MSENDKPISDAAQAPQGWKFAPAEPTDDMEAAAEDDYEQTGATFPRWKSAYRAMLDAAPATPTPIDLTDAYAGAREDLAIWKRRALEAEEKLRDSINKPCLEAKSTVSIRTYVASQIDIPYDVAVDRVREGWTDYKNSRFHPGAEEVAKKRASLRILEADALIALLGDS